MRRERCWKFCAAVGMLVLFVLWTMAVRCFDVRPIGPGNSLVGFAGINSMVHELTGVHMQLYVLTDWLGLVPVAFGFGFAVLGLVQLIMRRSIFRVDGSILLLGIFYIAVAAAYILFEMFPVNCRPVLIEGRLEASYPSSTTLLVLCVMPTTVMQLKTRIKNSLVERSTAFAITCFGVFMVAVRMISGVHWFTDIVGGVLLSAGLVNSYSWLFERTIENERQNNLSFGKSRNKKPNG